MGAAGLKKWSELKLVKKVSFRLKLGSVQGLKAAFCLLCVFFMLGKLASLSKSRPARPALKWLFPCVSVEMFPEVLLRGQLSAAEVAHEASQLEMNAVHMPL
jgi:hypothetical protein